MNDKLQYASMLEIPVNTCNITYQPIKKKKSKKKKASLDEVKTELITKVNSAVNVNAQESVMPQVMQDSSFEQEESQGLEPQNYSYDSVKKSKKRSTFILAQTFIICALIATIAITSYMNENSGLNVFFKSVFGSETQVAENIDDRTHLDFAPVIAMDNLAEEVSGGVMTFSGNDSAYACADGVVKSLTLGADGKYTMEISHCDNFVSIFRGLTYAYAEVGDKVYSSVPVGYYKEGLEMCFNGENGSVITNYEVIDGTVVWSV